MKLMGIMIGLFLPGFELRTLADPQRSLFEY
jgi:hypothetical protein